MNNSFDDFDNDEPYQNKAIWKETFKQLLEPSTISQHKISTTATWIVKTVRELMKDQFSNTDLVIDEHGNLYITSTKSCIFKLNVYSKNPELQLFAGIPGVRGSKDGNQFESTFQTLKQIILDRDGNLYISDAHYANFTIQSLPLRKITIPKKINELPVVSTPIQKIAASAIAIDQLGYLFVAHAGKITKYSMDTGIQSTFCKHSLLSNASSLVFNTETGYLYAACEFELCKISPSGKLQRMNVEFVDDVEWSSYGAMAMDSHNNILYVIDNLLSKVRQILCTPNEHGVYYGRVIASLGQDGQFSNLVGIAVDQRTRHIYLTDNSVLKKLTKKVAWSVERLLWLARLKNSPEDCHLASLPKDIILVVLQELIDDSLKNVLS